MIFGPAGTNVAAFVRVRASDSLAGPARAAPLAPAAVTDWEAVGAARRGLARVIAAIDELDTQLSVRTGRGGGQGLTATSTASIGLDPAPATFATMTSAQEVNTTPTSFTPFGPDWDGTSTALLTLGGVYDGSNGTGTLTFESQRTGVHGVNLLKIDVLKPDGKKLTSINVSPTDPLDTVYSLGNGLTLTLGAGALTKNETATIQLFQSVGSAPDPDKPFDGVRNDNPNLQPGLSVSTGSFEINGQTIAVLAGDSINSVLTRINQSAAGVSASYDPVSERISLVQRTAGSAPGIVLANDTSGFLAASKLSAASVVPGTDHQPDVALAALAPFASVAAGSLTINGTALAIDPATDSLNDVIARINAGNLGVTATLSGDASRVSIGAAPGWSRMTLQDDSGLLAALHIAAGEYRAEGRGPGMSKPRSYRVADALESVSRALDGLFRNGPASGIQGMDALRSQLRAAFGGFAASAAGDPDAFGLHLATGVADTPLPFEADDRRRLTRQLQRDVSPVRELLVGGAPGSESGLLTRLRAVIETHRAGLGLPRGTTGSLIDRIA